MNLFTILNPTPLSAQEVASRIGADLRALTVLPDALSAMDLLVNPFFSLFPIGYGHFASPKGFLTAYPGPSQSILSMDRVGVNGFSFQRLVTPPAISGFLSGRIRESTCRSLSYSIHDFISFTASQQIS